MRGMLRRLFFPVFVAAFAALASARAAVVAQSNDLLYTQPPTSDDFGFANVGTVFNSIGAIPATGVYLGDGWMLSAYHNTVNAGGVFTFQSITLGGVGYSADVATATRLHNADSSLADLTLFRLTTIPAGLSAMPLSGVAPSINADARMMGNGQDRELTETRWIAGTPWAEVASGGNRLGYKLAATRAMRWGTNTVDTAPAALPDLGYGAVTAFSMDWDNVSGEAMATGGDSGGGVFVKNGGVWELAGIMLYTAELSGQPAGTVVYGDATYAASLATYKAEIVQTMGSVPEPASTVLVLIGAGLLSRRRKSS